MSNQAPTSLTEQRDQQRSIQLRHRPWPNSGCRPNHRVHGGIQTDYSNLTPRLGFAYTVTPNTVVRGGFSLTFAPENTTSGSAPGEPSACGDLRRLYAGASGCRDHASRCAEPRPKHQVCRCPAHTEPNSYTNPSGSISAASDPHFRSTYIEQFDLPAEREFSGSVGTLSSIPLYRSAGSSSYHAMDKACMASARCWPKAGRRTASCGTPACRSPSPTSPTAAAHASPQAPATGPTCCAAVRSATSPLAAGSTPLPSRFSPPVPSVQSTTTSCTAPACSAWTCRCSRTWTCTKG